MSMSLVSVRGHGEFSLPNGTWSRALATLGYHLKNFAVLDGGRTIACPKINSQGIPEEITPTTNDGYLFSKEDAEQLARCLTHFVGCHRADVDHRDDVQVFEKLAKFCQRSEGFTVE